MTLKQMIKYYTTLDMEYEIREELLKMHPDDLRLVLSIILPEGTDIELSVKEIEQWKQELNLDTMKK